jgi:PAS domain-containing protein
MAARGYMDPTLAGLPQWQALAVAPLASAASSQQRLVFGSEAFFELVRWSPEQLTQHNWLEVLFPEAHEREVVMAEVSPLYTSGGVLRHRINAVCGDGVRRVFDLTTTAISMPDGSPGLMAILVDSSGIAIPVGGGERGIEQLVERARGWQHRRLEHASTSQLHRVRAAPIWKCDLHDVERLRGWRRCV